MKNIFTAEQRIGEIGAIFPKATDIFMVYGIDFCCGGDRILGNVLREQNINEEEIITKINEAYEEFMNTDTQEVDWRIAPKSELIDYIVNKHHSFMRSELPIAGELLSKILKVHYIDHGDVLSKLHKLFSSLKAEIEEHLIKEEEALFPLIKEYENNNDKETLNKALKVMEETENEHDNAGDILKEMRRITGGFKAPANGCGTFDRAYQKLEEIEKDLFKHIHLENNILFERLKR